MIGSRMMPDAETLRYVKQDPFLAKELEGKNADPFHQKVTITRTKTLAPYKGTLDLLRRAENSNNNKNGTNDDDDDGAGFFDDDEEELDMAVARTTVNNRRVKPSSTSSSEDTTHAKRNRGVGGGAGGGIPLASKPLAPRATITTTTITTINNNNNNNNTNGTSSTTLQQHRPHLVDTKFAPPTAAATDALASARRHSLSHIADTLPPHQGELLRPLHAIVANKSQSRAQTFRLGQLKLANSLVMNLEDRRKRYANRFMILGDFWMRKLRYCGWRQSLRMAFEVPALHSAKHAGMGHRIPKPQFIAACQYAITRNVEYLSVDEFDTFLAECYDLFDVENEGTIDYREVLCTLLFFRIPPEGDTSQLIYTWFRYFDGDVEGGLLFADFLKMMTTLCTTSEEVTRVLRLMDLPSLERVPGPRTDVIRVVNGQIIPATTGPLARGKIALDKARDATIQNLSGEEAHRLAVQSVATRLDARAMGVDSRVQTADVVSDTHAELTGSDVRDNFNPRSIRGSKYPFSRKDLFLVPRTPEQEVVLRNTAEEEEIELRLAQARETLLLAQRQQNQQREQSDEELDKNDDDDENGNERNDDEQEEFVDDRSEGERARDDALDLNRENDGKNNAKSARRAGNLWDSTLKKNKLILALSRNLQRAYQDDDDPTAPWNRGAGTLMESRVRPRARFMHLSNSQLYLDQSTSAGSMTGNGMKQGQLHTAMGSPSSGRARSAGKGKGGGSAPSTRDLFASPAVPKTLTTIDKISGIDSSSSFGALQSFLHPPPIEEITKRLHEKNTTTSSSDDILSVDLMRGGTVLTRRPAIQELRGGNLYEPLHIKRVTLHMIKYMIQMSPGLLDEIHRLRLLRLPPSIRSAYLAYQMSKQVELARAKYEKLREDVQVRRALTLWRQRQMINHFDRWKSFARFVIWERVKINSFRARRATRMWYMFARNRIVTRAKNDLADAHSLKVMSSRTFRQWVSFRNVQKRANHAKWVQAVAFHRHTLLERYFQALHERAETMRARKHFAASLVLRCLHGWKRAVEVIKFERKGDDLAARVGEERVRRTKEELERADREREAAEAAAAEANAFEQFMQDAANIKEEERLAKIRADADRKLRDFKITQMQLAAREENYLLRKEAFRVAFEKEWDAKIAAAVSEARAEAAAYVIIDGREAMREDAKILLMGETVEAVSQAESDFRAFFDMADGCIHFIREEDLTMDPPRERLDLNMDSMRLKDATVVASAHYIAKCGCRMRAEKLIEKAKGWVSAVANESARVFQRRWNAKQGRLQFLNELRKVIEQFIDPQTGSLYYYNVETGKVFDTKPHMFRNANVHPLPDYFIKYDESTPGSRLYAHRKIPWKISPTPPPGYLLCYVCSVEFATRRCHGMGCHKYLYCYSCFTSYHPRDDPQWQFHWDTAQRIEVKALTRKEMEEEEVRAQQAAEDAAIAAERAAAMAASGFNSTSKATKMGGSGTFSGSGSKKSITKNGSGANSDQYNSDESRGKSSRGGGAATARSGGTPTESIHRGKSQGGASTNNNNNNRSSNSRDDRRSADGGSSRNSDSESDSQHSGSESGGGSLQHKSSSRRTKGSSGRGGAGATTTTTQQQNPTPTTSSVRPKLDKWGRSQASGSNSDDSSDDASKASSGGGGGSKKSTTARSLTVGAGSGSGSTKSKTPSGPGQLQKQKSSKSVGGKK